MKTSISIWGFIILLVMCLQLLGLAIPANAETIKYKAYAYTPKKEETVMVDNVEGRGVGLAFKREFVVFENGWTATDFIVLTSESFAFGKSGSYTSYITVTFVDDGSTIIKKGRGSWSEAGVEFASTVIRGTGRFEGIKGADTCEFKFLPVEEGEFPLKYIADCTLNYTLPSK